MKNLGLAKLLSEKLYKDRYQLMGVTIAKSMSESYISPTLSLGAMAMVGRNYSNCDIAFERDMDVNEDTVTAVEKETNKLADELLLKIKDTIDGKSYPEILGALYTLTLNMVEYRDEEMKKEAEKDEQKEEKCTCERCACACDEDTKEEESEENPLDFLINALQKAKKDGKLSIREIKL